MKKLFLLLFIVSCLKGFTQTDTIFYNVNNDRVASLNSAAKYETTTRSVTDTSVEIKREFTKAGQQITEDYYYINRGAHPPESKDKAHIGSSRVWYDTGKLKREIMYNNNKMDGTCKTYWENGQLKRDDIYEDGKFISGKCYTPQGKDTTHYNFEIMPEFKGGIREMMQYIQKNLKYPEKSKEAGIQGKVFVKFVIETDGSITNVTVLKGVNEELDKEAVRVIQNMPNWKPGLQDGVLVRVYFNIPLIFKSL